jgi:ACS family D-galactonate transporter-like MFS transporter
VPQPRLALPHPWRLLALLVLSIFINFIDRANLSVAAEDLRRELMLRPSQLGLLLSAFFWTYAAFQLVAGWLVDRYNVFWVYGIGFFIWSLATGLTGAVTGFSMLFALRLVLGMGESVAYPAYSRILASGFPEKHRGFCNAAIDAGSKLGPAMGTLIGGLIVAAAGWRSLFFILGAGALLWLIPWFLSIPKNMPARAPEAVGGPGFLDIVKRREVWGTFLGLFAINWSWYFLITWLPSYLRAARGFSQAEMAVFGSVPFWCIAASSLTFGWLSDRLIASGLSVSTVRRGFAAGGLISAGALMLPVALVASGRLALILLTIATGLFGLCTSNIWAITQRLAGPAAAGKWTGAQNAFGNLAGVFGPWLTGVLVERTGSYVSAFALVSVVLVLGAISFLVLIPRLDPLVWPER